MFPHFHETKFIKNSFAWSVQICQNSRIENPRVFGFKLSEKGHLQIFLYININFISVNQKVTKKVKFGDVEEREISSDEDDEETTDDEVEPTEPGTLRSGKKIK